MASDSESSFHIVIVSCLTFAVHRRWNRKRRKQFRRSDRTGQGCGQGIANAFTPERGAIGRPFVRANAAQSKTPRPYIRARGVLHYVGNRQLYGLALTWQADAPESAAESRFEA